MFSEIKITQGETAQFAEAATKAQELNAELARKLNEKRSYSADSLERLNALVPESINEVRVLTDLNEIARGHNMLFGNVSVEKTDDAVSRPGASPEETGRVITHTVSYPDITTTSMSFSLIGTYEQFKSFLADAERSLVMVEVTNIDFVAGEGDLQQFDLTVTLFALPPIE